MAGKIYITGATGRLGGTVLKKVNAVPLVRKPSGLKKEIVTDFSKESLKKILKDAKTIIHIAGSVDFLDKDAMWDANVNLTRNIVNAAPKNSRIIFAGSFSVYGKVLAEIPADENTPVNPDSLYARSKYEAEKVVAGHKNHVILRIGTIYGPQFHNFFKVMRMVEKNKMKMIGHGHNRLSFVHVDDVADVFVNALKKGKGVYVVTGDPMTQEHVMEFVSQQLGARMPDYISLRVARMLATMGEIWYSITKQRPSLTREEIYVLGYDRSFSCNKAKKELGFSPRPLSKGMAEMVAEYRKQ